MVGKRIRKKRRALGLTLKELSALVDISVSFLSDIENGRSNPSLERLKEIAEALECSVSFLLGEDFEEEKQFYHAVYKKKSLKDEIKELFNDEKFIQILNEFDGFKDWSQQEIEELMSFLKIRKRYKGKLE